MVGIQFTGGAVCSPWRRLPSIVSLTAGCSWEWDVWQASSARTDTCQLPDGGEGGTRCWTESSCKVGGFLQQPPASISYRPGTSWEQWSEAPSLPSLSPRTELSHPLGRRHAVNTRQAAMSSICHRHYQPYQSSPDPVAFAQMVLTAPPDHPTGQSTVHCPRISLRSDIRGGKLDSQPDGTTETEREIFTRPLKPSRNQILIHFKSKFVFSWIIWICFIILFCCIFFSVGWSKFSCQYEQTFIIPSQWKITDFIMTFLWSFDQQRNAFLYQKTFVALFNKSSLHLGGQSPLLLMIVQVIKTSSFFCFTFFEKKNDISKKDYSLIFWAER